MEEADAIVLVGAVVDFPQTIIEKVIMAIILYLMDSPAGPACPDCDPGVPAVWRLEQYWDLSDFCDLIFIYFFYVVVGRQ